MIARNFVKHISFKMLFIALGLAVPLYCQQKPPLTNTDIVAMVKSRLSITVIKAAIDTNYVDFDTSSKGLANLRSNRVARTIIDHMVKKVAEQTKSAKSTGPTGAKRPGTIRIGIATTISRAPIEQNLVVHAKLFDTFYGGRDTSLTEVVFLKEKLDLNIFAESLKRGCDFVLFLNLDSEIKSAEKKHGLKLNMLVTALTQGLSIAQQGAEPTSKAYSYAEKGAQMGTSLQSANELMTLISDVTKKKDKIALRYRFAKVMGQEFLLDETVKEVIAKRDREPILDNIIIEIGNQIATMFVQRRP